MGKRFGELLCDEQAHYETAFRTRWPMANGRAFSHVRRDTRK